MSNNRIDRKRDRRRAAVDRMNRYLFEDSKAKRLGTKTEDQWELARYREIERLSGLV